MQSYDLTINVTNIAFDDVIHNVDASNECANYIERMFADHLLRDHVSIDDYGDDIHVYLHRDHVTDAMRAHDDYDGDMCDDDDPYVLIVAYMIQ